MAIGQNSPNGRSVLTMGIKIKFGSAFSRSWTPLMGPYVTVLFSRTSLNLSDQKWRSGSRGAEAI
jgi:hypothetical protein